MLSATSICDGIFSGKRRSSPSGASDGRLLQPGASPSTCCHAALIVRWAFHRISTRDVSWLRHMLIVCCVQVGDVCNMELPVSPCFQGRSPHRLWRSTGEATVRPLPPSTRTFPLRDDQIETPFSRGGLKIRNNLQIYLQRRPHFTTNHVSAIASFDLMS